MGEEIGATGFTGEDRAQFARRLARETAHVRRLFETNGFAQSDHMIGFEIETWIVDHNYFPAPVNTQLLAALDDPLEILRRLGGREIAAMAGAIISARLNHIPVVLDGYVACAAAALLLEQWLAEGPEPQLPQAPSADEHRPSPDGAAGVVPS